MMKMATGEGFPLRQGAETGLDWLSVATEASGGETPDLLFVLEVLGYMCIYGYKGYDGGPKGGPRGRGARPRGVGAPPTLVSTSFIFWRRVQVYPVGFLPKVTLQLISFRFDSV